MLSLGNMKEEWAQLASKSYYSEIVRLPSTRRNESAHSAVEIGRRTCSRADQVAFATVEREVVATGVLDTETTALAI